MTALSAPSVAVLCSFVMITAGCSRESSRVQEAEAENAARQAVGNAAAEAEDAGRMLAVGSRNDLLFEEGFSVVSFDPPGDYRNGAFRWMGQRGHVRVRGHGEKAMFLKMRGWIHEKVVRAKGVVTLYLDGVRLFDTGAVERGHWHAEVRVPPTMLHGSGWSDLIMTVSAVAFHWSEPPALHVVVINELEWSEVP